MTTLESVKAGNEAKLEKRHIDEFKDVARAMENEEKYIVLKTIPTQVLIHEIEKRVETLEGIFNAGKLLFKVQE